MCGMSDAQLHAPNACPPYVNPNQMQRPQDLTHGLASPATRFPAVTHYQHIPGHGSRSKVGSCQNMQRGLLMTAPPHPPATTPPAAAPHTVTRLSPPTLLQLLRAGLCGALTSPPPSTPDSCKQCNLRTTRSPNTAMGGWAASSSSPSQQRRRHECITAAFGLASDAWWRVGTPLLLPLV